MQYKKETLFKKIAENSGMDIEYVKILMYEVFEGIKEWSRNPTNLILNVKHLGRYHWKRKNLKRDLTLKKEFQEGFNRSEEHKKFVENANLILGIYEVYEKDQEDHKKEKYKDKYIEKQRIKEIYGTTKTDIRKEEDKGTKAN